MLHNACHVWVVDGPARLTRAALALSAIEANRCQWAPPDAIAAQRRAGAGPSGCGVRGHVARATLVHRQAFESMAVFQGLITIN
jgi:hypothetical protein